MPPLSDVAEAVRRAVVGERQVLRFERAGTPLRVTVPPFRGHDGHWWCYAVAGDGATRVLPMTRDDIHMLRDQIADNPQPQQTMLL